MTGDAVLQTSQHFLHTMTVSMRGGDFIVTVFCDRNSFFFVGQVVIDLLQQVFFAFIAVKVYPWGKVFEKILLIIT